MLKPAPAWITERPIAHRALHDKDAGCAENSFAAFDAAIQAGYAIECDLQVSSTGEPVVFHDPVLGRMTGISGNVRDHAPDALSAMKLLGTNDGIYTLSHHLKQVDGKVPLILELKGIKDEDSGFVEGVARALRSYDGQVAVMSFDHRLCSQFAELIPDIPRGLTAEGGDDTYETHLQAMHDYDLQFVSYDVNELPVRFVEEMRVLELPVITWTVRNAEQIAATYAHADQMTFEGFLPENSLNRTRYGS